MRHIRLVLLLGLALGVFAITRLAQSSGSPGGAAAPSPVIASQVTALPTSAPTATRVPVVSHTPTATRTPIPGRTTSPAPTRTALTIVTPTPCGYGYISVSAHVSYGSEQTGIEIDAVFQGYNVVVRRVSVGNHTVRLLFPNNTHLDYAGAVADCKSWSIIYSS